MKTLKKLLSLTLAIVMLVAVLPINILETNASTLNESEFASKIAYLRTVYRDKEYWNKYNSCGYEGTGTIKCKCSTSCASYCSCYCGKFYLNNNYYGGQCFGFANKMGYLVFGSVPTASWKKYTSVSNYYAGDYVRVRNDRHSIFITKVSGDTITYVDCNNYGPCQVKWDRTISKTSLASITTYVYHLDGNNLTGTGVSSGSSNTSTVVWTKNNSYQTPITAYPAATSGKITLYNSNLEAYSQSARYVAYNDLCTIDAIYANGYCSVTYPTSSGTNTAYAKISDFITNSVTPYSYTPTANLTTYTRANLLTTFGSVFTTDKCTVVGKSGDKLQLIYPTSSGYKLGWISVPTVVTSDFPTPLYGYNSSPSVRTTVYESVSTMGTYYGQIFVDDKCTLNAVNVSEGWIQVTYPVGNSTKTGYVYLDQFIPTSSKLTTFYTTTVTKQTTSYRKSDMGTAYGYVSAGDKITVVGKSGNKLQVIYPVDSGGYKIAWIYSSDVQKNLTDISVTSNPAKTTYIEGENLDKSGLAITAKYDDGSTADVTTSCSFSGYSNTVGVKTVNVSYGGKQTAFTVTVKSKSPTSIKVTSEPTKTNYFVGDSINLDGLTVQAVYNNGTTAEVKDYDVLIGSDTTSSAGNKAITITYVYNDVAKSDRFNITVLQPKIELSQAELLMKIDEMAVVTAVTEPSTQKVYWTSSDTAVATVSDGNIMAVGSGTTTISVSFNYNGINYRQEIAVTVLEAPITLKSVSINSNPVKTRYKVGEFLDTTGMSLLLKYNDGSSQIVSSGYTVNNFSSETAGAKTIVVSYEGMTTSFDITVENTNVIPPGDVNGDGKVNMKDYSLLQQYLNNWDVTIMKSSADVNADGKINMKDYSLLQKYLNGCEVELKNSTITDGTATGDEISYTKGVYGESELGRELAYYCFEPENYTKTLLLNFAIHGFEDEYAADGQVLVDTANNLINYYANNAEELKNTRLIVIPCANPDGLYEGTSNNGFGRCNANGVDLNRDFDANYTSYSSERNYTPYAFSAAESRALRDLYYSINPDIVIDFHGWLNYTIGNYELAKVFNEELGLAHHVDFTTTNASGYFSNWAYQQGALSLLVEFTDSNTVPFDNLVNAVNRLLSGDYNSVELDSQFSKFERINCYTLSTGRVTTYKFFDEPFSSASYIDGATDNVIILGIYENDWAKVQYPVSGGNKVAYAPINDFIPEEDAVDGIYKLTLEENMVVYTRDNLENKYGTIYSSDQCYVVSDTGNALQVIYELDEGGWKMGWIKRELE